jgi:ABC-2 type transport system ATP-binding protein
VVRKLTYAIETRDITKRFIQTKGFGELLIHPFRKKELIALEKVSINVTEGELFGILGPNGAGKTTLIKVLCTLILHNEGTAYVNGYDVVEEDEKVKASIGLVTSEERSFYWRLTGRKNLRFFASLHNFSNSEMKSRIDEVLRIVGLEDRADDRFDNYSSGMRHRMAIARGLLNDPAILFMDEPTSSLDPYAAHKLRAFIKEDLVRDKGKTVFLSTHNLQEAEQLCDRIAIIDKARIKVCGALRELTKMVGKQEMYVIEVKNLSKSVLDELKCLEGVSDFSDAPIESDGVSLEILISNSETVLPQIIEMIVNTGGKLMACNRKEAALDEIFAQIAEEGGKE